MATPTRGRLDSDFVIINNTRGKASVWAHFGFVKKNDDPGLVEKNRVACKLCRIVLKYSGNTTNLTDHMRRKHPTFLQQSALGAATSVSTVSNSTAPAAPPARDISITSRFFGGKLPCSSNRAKAISGAILQFIVKDMRPFSVVENSGFKNLVAVLEPRYTIPSRQHFSVKALPELYEQQKIEVKTDLAEAVTVALTTDGWTSRATESYITITSSHIDNEWKLKNYVLQVHFLCFRNFLSKYYISTKIQINTPLTRRKRVFVKHTVGK